MKPMESARPHVIIMVGIPGSGKSFFAEQFAETFKAPFVSYNKLFASIFGSPNFDESQHKIVERVADYMLSEAFKTKRTVIYEGATDLRSDRIAMAKKAHAAGYDPLFVWVQTEVYDAQKRALRPNDGRIALTETQFAARIKQFSPPHPTERAVVISGKHTYNTQLKAVLKCIVTPTPTPIFTNVNPAPRGNGILIR